MLTKIIATRQKILIVRLLSSGGPSLHFSFGTPVFWEAQSSAAWGLCPHMYLATTLQCPSPGSYYQCQISSDLEVVIAEEWKQEITCIAHVPALMSEGIILGVVVSKLMQLGRLCKLLWESPPPRSVHVQELHHEPSPATRGSFTKLWSHTDIYECLDSIITGMLHIPKIPAGDAFSVVPESCPASSHILFSAFFLCIIICDLSSFLLHVYAQHSKQVDWHYICQLV